MTCTLKMLNIADALYTPRVLRMIQLRRRSLTNITTSLDRPHPGAAPPHLRPRDAHQQLMQPRQCRLPRRTRLGEHPKPPG